MGNNIGKTTRMFEKLEHLSMAFYNDRKTGLNIKQTLLLTFED